MKIALKKKKYFGDGLVQEKDFITTDQIKA